jgi:5-methylthioadenosine/S-adenosylhomocysteine deaminase
VVEGGSLATAEEAEIRSRSTAAAVGLAARAGTNRLADRDWRSLVGA